MQAFEEMAASLLSHEGYWVRKSYKVELTKAEKNEIGRPSSPRWELDLIAYKPSEKELIVVECKGYQDSTGTNRNSFGTPKSDRYKLFNDEALRKVVFARLKRQLMDEGLITPDVKIRLGLITAKIRANDHEEIKKKFKNEKWILFDSHWIAEKLDLIAGKSYENEVVAVVAKQLLRNRD